MNREDFSIAVQRDGQSVYYFLLSCAGHRDDAEDLYQNSLRNAFKYRDSFDATRGSFRSWLRKIAINEFRGSRRQGRWTEALPDDLPAVDATTDTSGDTGRLTLESALRLLSPVQRAVLVMTLVDEMNTEEVAEELDMTRRAVENHLYRARKTLKSRWRESVE